MGSHSNQHGVVNVANFPPEVDEFVKRVKKNRHSN